MELPPVLKEGLRTSIMARRQARGQKQIQIEHHEPKVFELSVAEIEKKERRREQNRRAAQRCRTKKRMNQYSVVKKFEKVIEDNHYLQQQVETLRRERDDLKESLDQHRVSCTCVTKVDAELTHDIEAEPVSDEDSPTVPTKKKRTPTSFGCNQNTKTSVVSCVGSKSSPFFSSCDRNSTRIEQTFLTVPTCQPTSLSPATAHQELMLEYSVSQFQKHHESPSCMFTSFIPKTSILPHSHEHHQEHLPHYILGHHQQYYHLDHQMHIKDYQNSFHQYSVATRPPSVVPISNSVDSSISRNIQYPDLCRLLTSKPSPCQVIPATSNIYSTVPNASCSKTVTLQCPFSRDSVSTPDTSRSDLDNVRFSSVSSEGSSLDVKIINIQQDARTGEVPDTDYDDVFSMATPGDSQVQDANNNVSDMLDSNVVVTRGNTDNLFTGHGIIHSSRIPVCEVSRGANTQGTVRERSENSVNINNSMGIDDVHTLLMEISNDELLFFSANEENDPPHDILRDYMTHTPED